MNHRVVSPSNFLDTVAANVDNEKMDDASFRAFIRNTLPIVIGVLYENPKEK